MGLSKKEEFSIRHNKVADLAKALAHPARVAILEYLSKATVCVCGDIVDELPLSQATVSQHLRELKNAGLIKGDIEGTKVCYCINEKAWSEAKDLLSQFLVDIKKCC
jgi:DNA-binding transcriptional ArsR family regulator